MNHDELARVFLDAAIGRARSGGVRLGDGADHDMRRYAERGASEILQRFPAVELTDPIVQETREAFHRVVDEMIRGSAEIPGYAARQPGVIGELTLQFALDKLCPLFPFC